ncbi:MULTISPECIES: type VII secretion target [Thermocrispum]|jgi:hypothetical protein|nr:MULTISPECIES: type VII secretion target [Thermocrispum]
MEGAGFVVDAEVMKNFATKDLPQYTEQAGKFMELVDKADVSNESWGAVGLFTKQGYTNMLGSLKGLLDQMQEGCRQAGEKFSAAARVYTETDDEIAGAFKSIAERLGDD